MKTIANVLAYIFHPLFVPIFGLLVLMYLPSTPKSFLVMDSLYHAPDDVKKIILVLFGIFILVAPGVSLVLFKLNKTISSLQLNNQEERRIPIFMMSAYMFILFFFLAFQIPKTSVPQAVTGVALGATIGVFFAGLINYRFKISLHMLGMGMLSGAIYGYFTEQVQFVTWLLPLVFIVSGIVATSRLVLAAHSYKELLAGYILGFLSLFFSISNYI